MASDRLPEPSPGTPDPANSATRTEAAPRSASSLWLTSEATPEQTLESWRAYRSEYLRYHQELLQRYTECWKTLETLLEKSAELYRTLKPEDSPSSSLESLERLWREQTRDLLLVPTEQIQKARPVLQAVSAVQDFDRQMEELARRSPQSVEITNHVLVSMAGPPADRSLRARLRELRSGRKIQLPLRQLMQSHWALESQERLLADGDLQVTLAQAVIHLLVPWEAWRRQTLSAVTWSRPETETFASEREWWRRRANEIARGARQALESCEVIMLRAPGELSRSLVRARPGKPGLLRSARQHRSEALRYWARQQRAVDSLIHLELEMVDLASAATDEIRRSLQWLLEENTVLYQELHSVIEWLRATTSRGDGEQLAAFPAPGANLVSAEDRTSDLYRRIQEQAVAHLPSTIELAQPSSSLPPVHAPWRRVQPVRVFRGFLDSNGLSAAREGFREVETAHQPIVAEIERAREVVAYGLEEAERQRKAEAQPKPPPPKPPPAEEEQPKQEVQPKQEEPEATPEQIAVEAAKNALALLEHREQSRVDTGPVAERHLCQALAVTLLDTEIAVERSWLGLWAHVTRQTTSRALGDLAHLGLQAFGDTLQIAGRHLGDGYDWLLVITGWKAPPPAPRRPVENILQLRNVLELELDSRNLPAIYNRLFRLDPVEDPRFLVGRELEMTGLSDAKARWQAGAAVAVMLIGSRGSGKTSLLNCAALRVFTDVPVVTGSFSNRLGTAADIQKFLCEMFEIPEDGNLIEELNKQRRVIILEEFERTFLRQLGGFAALNEFLRILDATAQNNLWLVSMNQAAFQFLKATTRISECFSTRINAASVNPEALKQAIMQRHNLSGYRLHFEPSPRKTHYVARLRQLLGVEENREQHFFNSLYEQAEGNFRSAFELWRDSIERVEGGVVFTRQPLNPDYRPLMRELALEDNFILQAIMQHGSLTTDELAAVLRLERDRAWRRLRRMQDLEILEPEPKRPGYRVRPQATRFVQETLYASNLLAGGRS